MLCYPAFIATSIYRFAHSLYARGFKIVARMMTEYAHSKTGIDIHPGAKIGKSFSKNDDGSLVKGIKRHPNIGNNVVIYAGATILGGDTIIGDNTVIGGNSWITKSIY